MRNNNTTKKRREKNRVKGNKAEIKEKVKGERIMSALMTLLLSQELQQP